MNTVASPQTPFLREAPDLQRLPPLSRSDRPRLIKDVLRVGKWFTGDANGKPQYATFTAADLEAIAARFAEHTESGIVHPLCWGHTPPQSNDVHPKDCIADIAHCWAENDTLWIGVYVTEPDAELLTGQHRQVSAGLWPNWRDGKGKLWSGWSLMHAGIVAHAIIPDQHDFLQMAAPPPSPKGKRMTFDVVKEAINQLLEAVKPGTTLPDTVDESNIDDVLPMLISVVLGKPADDAPAEDAPAEPPVDVPAEDLAPMEMSAALKPLIDRLSAIETALAAKKASDAEAAFRSRVDELGSKGIHAGTLAVCLEMGAKLGWDQKVLDTAANAKPLEMGSKLGKHKSPAPASPSQMTEAEKAEAIAFMTRTPAKK